ncbi:NifU family protein [soil metagenome]
MNILDIYTEYTPNPDSLKFVINRLLSKERNADFRDKESSQEEPLPKALFELPYVKGVYISANFVTITKDAEYEWIEVIPPVRDFLRKWITEEQPILRPLAEVEAVQIDPNLTDVEQRIVATLDKFIKPAVEMDGGNIVFKSFNEGVVSLVMQGSCSGCPSSTMTLKAGIEGLLKKMIPEVTEVVAEAG